MLAVSLDELTLGALRKLEDVPPGWLDRVAPPDYRTGMLRGLETEAWVTSARTRRMTAIDRTRRPLQQVGLAVIMNYLRLMAVDHSDAVRRVVDELRTAADPCRVDAIAVDRKAQASVPWWNSMGRMAMPFLTRTWTSVVRTSLGLELTRNVLTLRERERQEGAWPREVASLPSAFCPGRPWNDSAAGDDTVSLTLELSAESGGPIAFRAARPRK